MIRSLPFLLFTALLFSSCGNTTDSAIAVDTTTHTDTTAAPDSITKEDSVVTAYHLSKEDSTKIADSVARTKNSIRDFN